MCDRSGMVRHERGRIAQMIAIARLRELAPDLPSPTFADAIDMLCHCGERLNKDCECDA